MHKSLSVVTSRQPDSQIEQVVRKWLVVFGSLFQREITPFLIGSWCELLADLDAGTIEKACMEAAKMCRFFPNPGDIRALLKQAESSSFGLEAETKWQQLLTWVRDNVFPDTGIRRGAPRLSPAVEHAARAAGGVYFLERCSQQELVFARKNFLAAYGNVHEAGKSEHLIGEGEAKQILKRLAAPAPGAITKKAREA